MKNKIIMLFILVAIIFIGNKVFFSGDKSLSNNPEEQVFCTADAKMCPDGSFVGRVGPDCEFAECPAVREALSATLGQTILNNGVIISPIEVVSDSRCPVDAECIWAGELKLKTRLQSGDMSEEVVISTQTPVVFSGKKISIKKVSPSPSTKNTTDPKDYVFEFSVE